MRAARPPNRRRQPRCIDNIDRGAGRSRESRSSRIDSRHGPFGWRFRTGLLPLPYSSSLSPFLSNPSVHLRPFRALATLGAVQPPLNWTASTKQIACSAAIFATCSPTRCTQRSSRACARWASSRAASRTSFSKATSAKNLRLHAGALGRWGGPGEVGTASPRPTPDQFKQRTPCGVTCTGINGAGGREGTSASSASGAGSGGSSSPLGSKSAIDFATGSSSLPSSTAWT